MNYNRPAFSSAFSGEGINILDPIDSFEDVDAEWAWGGSTGKGVKVAVIDSGIDATHPGVAGPVNGYVSVTTRGDDVVFDTEPHTDPYSHGTACASIIRSFAPECELYSVKVIGADLIGRGKVFAAGLRWAIDNKMDVCNMSLGTTKKDFYGVLHQLTDAAYFNNVILVTAANNTPTPSFPSVYASVISVGSHEVQDPYLFYYNPNPPVEFGASGINVRVAWLRGGWMTATGNSYATPHITGLVAKILGKHPNLTLFQVKSILRALSANIKRDDRARYHGGVNGAASTTPSLNWKDWTHLPLAKPLHVPPAATTLPNGKLGLIRTDTEDGLLHVEAFESGAWDEALVFEGDVRSSVNGSVILNDKQLIVAATNVADGQVYMNAYDGETQRGWRAIEGAVRSSTSPVLTLYNGDPVLIVLDNQDQHIYVKAYSEDGWSKWRDLGGDLSEAASLTAASFAKQLHLFGRSDTDNHIYLNTYGNRTLSGWNVLGGEFTTTDTLATVLYANKLFLFARNSVDQQVYYTATDGMAWGTWQPLPYSSGLEGVGVVKQQNRLMVFATDPTTNQLWATALA